MKIHNASSKLCNAVLEWISKEPHKRSFVLSAGLLALTRVLLTYAFLPVYIGTVLFKQSFIEKSYLNVFVLEADDGNSDVVSNTTLLLVLTDLVLITLIYLWDFLWPISSITLCQILAPESTAESARAATPGKSEKRKSKKTTECARPSPDFSSSSTHDDRVGSSEPTDHRKKSPTKKASFPDVHATGEGSSEFASPKSGSSCSLIPKKDPV